jgi:3',5'-cyclic AMP phosphodiesterase CpdA
MTVRIAQISDLHVSPEKPAFNANMHRLLDAVRAEKPDLLLNTGDLGLFGERDNGDLALALEAHRGLAIETRFLPGNHDVGEHPDIPDRVWVEEASLDRYRRQAGADYWTFDLPGWRLVGLNSLIVGTGLSGDTEQLDMLRRASLDRGGRALALVMHKPLMDLAHDDPAISNRFTTLRCRRLILDAIGERPADLVICGHLHQYRDLFAGGSRHIWCPAASFIIGDPWQPTYGAKAVGYLEHLFHPDGTHAHRLMTVRDLVHHDLALMPELYGDVTRRGPGNA